MNRITSLAAALKRKLGTAGTIVFVAFVVAELAIGAYGLFTGRATP